MESNFVPYSSVSPRCYGGNPSPMVSPENMQADTALKTKRRFSLSCVDPGKELPQSFDKGRSISWNERFQDLVDFKGFFGHCNVPSQQRKYKSLHKWIGKQREAYKLHKKGQHSPLTNDRIKKLHSIGIKLEPYTNKWDDKFEELLLFHKTFGHLKVPQNGKSKYTRLGQWLARQKRELRPTSEMKAEGTSFRSRQFERSQKLESLGIVLC